jgi:histidyl-tRNA synthetase
LLSPRIDGPQVWVAAEGSTGQADARRAATALRHQGVSVEYALRAQPLMKQVKAAKSAGATWVLTLHDEAGEGTTVRHTWNPDPPAEWDQLLTSIGL